jgi:hypothetical protein
VREVEQEGGEIAGDGAAEGGRVSSSSRKRPKRTGIERRYGTYLRAWECHLSSVGASA